MVSSEDSPQLENIKVETNGIPDETCKAFTNLVAVAESNHSELMEFLSKARNNEPIPPGIFKEQEESLKRAGTTAFDGLHKGASKVWSLLDSSRPRFLRRIIIESSFCGQIIGRFGFRYP
jgi:hypothetical protein